MNRVRKLYHISCSYTSNYSTYLWGQKFQVSYVFGFNVLPCLFSSLDKVFFDTLSIGNGEPTVRIRDKSRRGINEEDMEGLKMLLFYDTVCNGCVCVNVGVIRIMCLLGGREPD